MEKWCRARGVSPGQVLELQQVWELSKKWYHDRLSPDFAGRTLEQAEEILRSVGLTDPFWYR